MYIEEQKRREEGIFRVNVVVRKGAAAYEIP
jgi:hypothetical protein